MLPNLRFLICGILFCLVLFMMAGTGAMLPDARTRIGEMPEVGRPLMQQSIAEVAAPLHFYRVTVGRRGDEPEPQREAAPAETAQPDADRPASLLTTAGLQNPGRAAPPVPVPAVPPVLPAETRHDERPDEAGPPQQVAALAVPAENSAATPRLADTPPPPARPVANALRRHLRILSRRRRLLQQEAAAQTVAPTPAASSGVAAGYSPSR